MKTKIIIQIHSCVDVITNSSSELFSITGNKQVVESFIEEYIKEHGREYSGCGGSIDVETFKEYIDNFIKDANRGCFYFDRDGSEYLYGLATTYEEKFNLILQELRACYKTEFNDYENLLVLDVDNNNQGLIEALKETFPNYIDLT
jgi:hypothetical protein